MFVGVVTSPIEVTLRLYTSIVFVVVVENPSMFLNPFARAAAVGAVVAAVAAVAEGAVMTFTIRLPFISSNLTVFVI